MFDFKGKVALVTGGGGELGRATILALAKAGAKVAVVDLNREAGLDTVNQVRAASGEAIFIRADVTLGPDVQAYVQETLKAYGRIDIFFNNAGWEGVVKPIVETPDDMFDKVIAINVRGVFLGLKHVLPVMIAQKSGTVINSASQAGHIGAPGLVGYIASKHAVMGITKTAALEVAALGIRVNAICPGAVNTRMMRSIEDGMAPGAGAAVQQELAASTPDGRYAEPHEVANLVLFLASDLSSHIVGQGMLIDGGSVMK